MGMRGRIVAGERDGRSGHAIRSRRTLSRLFVWQERIRCGRVKAILANLQPERMTVRGELVTDTYRGTGLGSRELGFDQRASRARSANGPRIALLSNLHLATS